MPEAFICDGVRTPIGRYGGALASVRADDLAAVPRDVNWPCVLADLAALCAHVCETEPASVLWPHLLPYRGHVVLTGGYVCVGSADRFLGMLAHTLDRLDDAVAHYTTALKLEQRLKAAPHAARTRYWWAHTLRARGAQSDEEHARRLLEAVLFPARELGMRALAGDTEELLVTSRHPLT